MTELPSEIVKEILFFEPNNADAILVIPIDSYRYQYHVNKAILSYHSDYFNTLFNSDFKEKSMAEIEIKDVNYIYFKKVLSLVHGVWTYLYESIAEELLEMTDQFQLPAVKRRLELFLMQSKMERNDLMKLADQHQLNDLLNHLLSKYTMRSDFHFDMFHVLSEETNNKLFHKLLEVDGQIDKVLIRVPSVSIHESTFAKSDKTDAILVVAGKKLHVNKALLSYHSDYFNALFNSDFLEKSMEEIEIKDADFEAFATLLSFVHMNPIIPTKVNAEEVLELSERFLLPSVKDFLESFMTILDIEHLEKIRIGEKYVLEMLLENGIDNMMRPHFKNLTEKAVYKGFSLNTKNKLYYRYLIV